jgi:ubiquinone/menaquinone biosynthesis C-methylase UbiE
MDWKRYYENEHIVYHLEKELNEREKHLWQMVNKLIPEDSIESVLDVGCGAGHITNKFFGLGIPRVTGCDISPYRIDFAKELYPKCNFEVGSILDLKYGEDSFDLVVGIEILEHMEDLDKAIEEMRKVTRKWVLITVPFEQKIIEVLCPYCLNHFNVDGHMHSFKTLDIVNLVGDHDLLIQKITYHCSWSPTWKQSLSKHGVPEGLISMLQKVIVLAKMTEEPKPTWLGILAKKNKG